MYLLKKLTRLHLVLTMIKECNQSIQLIQQKSIHMKQTKK